jgi:hypothetical protein
MFFALLKKVGLIAERWKDIFTSALGVIMYLSVEEADICRSGIGQRNFWYFRPFDFVQPLVSKEIVAPNEVVRGEKLRVRNYRRNIHRASIAPRCKLAELHMPDRFRACRLQL